MNTQRFVIYDNFSRKRFLYNGSFGGGHFVCKNITIANNYLYTMERRFSFYAPSVFSPSSVHNFVGSLGNIL